jgi:ankyrin repeat protein
MARMLPAIAALALIAASCSPGSLPTVARHQQPWTLDGFPTTGEGPLDLDIAIRTDRLDDVRRLLDAGADSNARWGQQGDHHPLQEAVEASSGHNLSHRTEIVRLLLAHGADPNLPWCPFETRGSYEPDWLGCTSAKGMTPLIAAAAFDMTEVVEMLLAAGADPRTRDWSGGSALDYAQGEVTFELISRTLFPSVSTRDQEALAFLQAHGSIGWYPTPLNATPLSRAIGRIGVLMVQPPPISLTNGVISRDWTFERVGTSRVRLLLNIGADPNERITLFEVDWTPLALVVARGHSWMARVLLEGGADPNGRWCVPLYEGRTKNARPMDPACSHKNGTTPLMQAASSGRVDLLPALLEHGADPTLTNWNGKSAADLAATDEIRALLSQRHPYKGSPTM